MRKSEILLSTTRKKEERLHAKRMNAYLRDRTSPNLAEIPNVVTRVQKRDCYAFGLAYRASANGEAEGSELRQREWCPGIQVSRSPGLQVSMCPPQSTSAVVQ